MSYDLAVWEGQRPADNQAAFAVYRQLMDEVKRLGGSLEPATPAIAAYVRALLDRWPDITEEAGEDSPWSDGPLIGDASGSIMYFGMVYRMADETAQYAAELACQSGLVCFDPQLGRLRPFNDNDGPPVDVSLPAITCAACGRLIEVNESRAQTFRYGQRPVHLACLDGLAERALEVLVTHNEAVTCDDLACALGVSEAYAWEIANTLQARGLVTVDEGTRTATAT